MLLFCPKQPLRSKKKRQSIIVQVDNCAYNCTGGQLCTALSTLKIVHTENCADNDAGGQTSGGGIPLGGDCRKMAITVAEDHFFLKLIFVLI